MWIGFKETRAGQVMQQKNGEWAQIHFPKKTFPQVFRTSLTGARRGAWSAAMNPTQKQFPLSCTASRMFKKSLVKTSYESNSLHFKGRLFGWHRPLSRVDQNDVGILRSGRQFQPRRVI